MDVSIAPDALVRLFDADSMAVIAATARDFMEPFVPRDTGRLTSDVSVDSCPMAARITYNAPYAVFVYAGTRLGTVMQFQTTHHPLASAQWDQAAMRSIGR